MRRIPARLRRVPPVRFDVDLHAGLLDGAEVDEEVYRRAIERGAFLVVEYAKQLWAAAAQNAGLRSAGTYIRGITDNARVEVVSTGAADGATYEIVIALTNTASHASIVEDGHASFSLPQAIDWNATTGRIKRGKSGPYLHIPFRHAAYADADARAEQGLLPGTLRRMLPMELYQRAQRLARRERQGVGPIRAADGQFIAADRYKWTTRGGDPPKGARRLKDPREVGFAVDGKTGELYEVRRGERTVGRDRHGPLVNPAWQSSRFAGLFKSGPRGHTEYMTIRTVTPTSPGWNIPAQAGYGIARKVGTILASESHVSELLEVGMVEAMGGVR